MKFFHTNTKMKAHLYYSERCRRWLESSNVACEVVPGTGSQEDRAREDVHDRVLPPLQEHGPRPASPRQRDVIEYNEIIYDFLIDEITNKPDLNDFRESARTCILDTAVSWTDLRSTLRFLLETTDNEDAEVFGFDITILRAYIEEIMEEHFWDFLQSSSVPTGKLKSVAMYETRCEEIEYHFQLHGYEHIPRQFGRHRVLLHAYSGRRRIGDLQYYVDLLAAPRTVYIVHVVSLDIVVNATWGDASNPTTRAYWIGAVRARHVMAFVGGPPCETWSRARGRQDPTQGEEETGRGCNPRVLRDVLQLWGFEQTTLREIQQIIMGNTLLCFALWVVMELALTEGFAVLEHPAEPEDDPKLASIWRLPFVRMLLALPHVQKVRFAQGLMGSFAPKPTHLLVVNLPDLLSELHRNRVRTELPNAQAIGRDTEGRWKTTVLKEYAPAFCKSMANVLIRASDACPVNAQMPEPPMDFIQCCKEMTCTEYGQHIGADFAF